MSNEFINLDSGSNTREDFQLRYISISKYEGDWQSLPHTHQFSELFYVLSGEGSLLHSLASEVPFFCASPLSRSHPIFPDILHLSDHKTDCVRFSAPVCNIFDKAHLLFDC